MFLKDGEREVVVRVADKGQLPGLGRARLARELFSGRFRPGQSLQVDRIAVEQGMDKELVLKTLAEFQALGMITLADDFSASVNSPDPKGMQEAYEVRAALEEIAGRAAAATLGGNVTSLLGELDGMRTAFQDGNLDACIEHDINFHRSILKASQNEFLLRVWDSLALDLRMRAMIGNLSEHMLEVVESHQPIVDALQKGRGKQAGLLLRNHVETFSEYIKKAKSDSGFYKALQTDLEGAKDVQRAFFPPPSLSIPCLSCEAFYQPAHDIGGDYYDFLSLQGERWGIAIGDVSGKGIRAALLMASLQGSLRAQALHSHSDLSTLMTDVNQLVYGSSPIHYFASLFYAEYQPATRILRYVNAGHNPPIVLRPRDGRCEIFRLKAGGMPMGISSDAQFTTATFQLQVGDVLVGYTDGITEVQNDQGELWGAESFEKLLSSCGCEQPKEIIDRILNGVAGFAGGQRDRDDMTLVVMKVEEGCDGVGLTPASLRRVTELVHEKIEDELSLDQMAQSAGLSTGYFSQVFRKSTGETPHQFLLRHRIERAKEMLRDADARILDVAVACGFKTQQHFARVFRKMCGASPTEYRQEFLRHEPACDMELCSHDTSISAAAASTDKLSRSRQMRP
ncbi:MAG TPA: SpoIIE family protein phosphatase [Candidatus Binatia bacterium]|nr:SpoIIE family protein phosphatase [Candidatus Binatia bacterium]